MSANIRDIAKRCNVSICTVSYVLNNKGNIKQETRTRILKTLKKLNYDPYKNNPLAKKTLTKSIGLIVPRLEQDMSPFYYRAMITIKNVASSKDYDCLLFSEEDIEKKVFEEFHKGRSNLQCDGIIVFCPIRNWNRYLKVLQNWGIPCVLIRRKTNVKGIVTIRDDDYQGAWHIIEHLYKNGHRSIGLVQYSEEQDHSSDRHRAYGDFIKGHNLISREELIINGAGHDRTWVEEQIKNIMASSCKPTAFLCYDDEIAINFINILYDLGIMVPEDIAVASFNDDYPARIFNPPLTTVKIPVEEMITLACKIVFDYREDFKLKQADIELPNELIIRKSCGGKQICDLKIQD